MRKLFLFGVIITSLFADCAIGLKSSVSFKVIDSTSIVLYGPQKVFIRTFCFVSPQSSITVLKDSICDMEEDALYIDGQLCEAVSVKLLY